MLASIPARTLAAVVAATAAVAAAIHAAVPGNGQDGTGSPVPQIDLTPGFDPGPAPEMERLRFLAGRWRVEPQFGNPADPGSKWLSTRAVETTFESLLDGAFLQSSLSVTWPDGQVWRSISVWSYDRFRKEYRVGILDDLWGLLDVYEGQFVGPDLAVSNQRSQTFGPSPGGPSAMARVVLHDVEQDRFVLEWEGSTDGESWAPAGLRWVYERAP